MLANPRLAGRVPERRSIMRGRRSGKNSNLLFSSRHEEES
jgi:hypothetical protein